MDTVKDVVIEKAAVNIDLLHQELAAALGEDFVGVSVGGEQGQVRVHVRPGLAQSQLEIVQQTVVKHDAEKLSSEQQKTADRQAKLAALKKPWDQWTEADRLTLLQVLAEQAGILP